jgi:streptogramin lyase
MLFDWSIKYRVTALASAFGERTHSTFQRLPLVWLLLALMGLVAGIPHAAQAQTTITTGATGVAAFDHNGNFYYIAAAPPSYTKNQVYKVTYSAGTFSDPVLVATLTTPGQYLAVDDSGNLYVIGIYNTIRKETLSGGVYAESTLYTGVGSPRAIALDGGGNLYVLDTSYMNNRILKGTSSGSSFSFSPVVSGLNTDGGMFVDRDGNIYVADSTNNQILKYTSSGGSYTQSVAVSGNLASPRGVAVDKQGTLYVGDYSHARVLKETPASGGGYSGRLFDKYNTTSNIYSRPSDLAVNTEGDALVVYQIGSGGLGTLLAYQTSSQDRESVNFNSVPLGTSASQTVALALGAGGTLDHVSVTTQGFMGMDFADAGGGTCAAGNTYAAGDTCTVKVAFSPSQAGGRYGAATLLDNSGKTLATTYIYGTGTGSQITLDAYQKTLIGTPASPLTGTLAGICRGVAVDAAGNVYLADYTNKRVLKETPASGSYTESVIADGLAGPQGVAVDGGGNIYVTDGVDYVAGSGDVHNIGTVLKLTPSASGKYTQSTLASGLKYPGQIAVDASGNLYVVLQGFTGNGDSYITKLTLLPSGDYTSSMAVLTVAGGIAVDVSGNLYFGTPDTQGGGGLYKAALTSEGDYTVGGRLLDTYGAIAVDAAGDVYTFQTSPGAEAQVLKASIASDGSATVTELIGLYAASNRDQIAVDGAGNVYFTGITSVIPAAAGTFVPYPATKLAMINPAMLDFGSFNVGSNPGYGNDHFLVVGNIGTDPLSFAAPTSGNNPSIAPADFYSQPDGCTQATPGRDVTLTSGQSCRYHVLFNPSRVGQIDGAMTFTDDDKNVAKSTQTVPFKGVGLGTGTTNSLGVSVQSQTITSGTASSNLTAVIAYNAAAPAGAVTFVVDSGSPVTGSCSSASSAETCIAAYATGSLAVGSHTIAVSIGADANYSAATGMGTLTVTAAPTAPQADLSPTSVSFGSVNVGATSTPQTFTLKNSGNAALPISSISTTGTNASMFVIGNNTCGSTLDAGASCSIGVSFKPSATGNATATLTVVDTIGTQTASLSGTGAATAAADFNIAATSNQQTVQRGSSVSYAIQLRSAASDTPFTNAVTLSASGLPAGASASFSPTSLVPGTTQATTSTMTITVPVLSAQLKNVPPRPFGALPAVASLACAFLLWPLRRRRRGLTLLILLIAGIACAAGLTACGSGTGFAPPGSTSTITVTGISGSTTHTTTVTLKVN